MSGKKKYLYVRNDWKKRDITIVSDIFSEGEKTFVKCAWAFRHKSDKFIKKEGRKIADLRFEENDPKYTATFEIPSDKVKFYYIAVNILSNILSKDTTPRTYFDDLLSDMSYYNHLSNYLSAESQEERRKHIEESWKKFKLL